MHLPQALQVLIVTHFERSGDGEYPRPNDYTETIHDSFFKHDNNPLIKALSLVDEQGTGASVKRYYMKRGLPPPFTEDALSNAAHTIVVLFATPAWISDPDAITWAKTIADPISKSGGVHSLIILGTSEETLSALRANSKGTALESVQSWSVEKLGEYALRPLYAALFVLNRAHRLVAKSSKSKLPPKAVLFISHAKLDGLPLAQALSHLISQFPWLDQFYDARDIQSGDDFREILEHGVLNSMLIILRTDIYDLRFWCRQEVMWAEANDRPALLVDARTELSSRPSSLGFTGIPSVRIPDGNLVRILIEGIREWVRIAVLYSRYEAALKTLTLPHCELLSRQPSLISLAEAVERLKSKATEADTVLVIHADPPLESTFQKAAQLLLKSAFPKGSVLSFKTFLSQLP